MTGRDRLRELLDAVLDEGNASLADMAGGAYTSPYHFARELSRHAGEPPVAMRRRVMLERAAWQLRQGTSVTEAATVNPEQKVTVRGDRHTAYANIVTVLDICKGAGIQEPYLDTVLTD